ncbi:MAG: helix-turn-helix domain-containing protein [Elusimicrobia bacterium]|nr:helix-turn-helix domain-containing protein [Elusimicrobiota bacterium]
MKRRKKSKPQAPPQVTLGGEIGLIVFKRYVLPLLKNKELSTWTIAEMLGVSAMTVSRWRRAYA